MKRTKDPAVLFYTADFLSGVSDLTMEERGQYITLLCLQHQKGHLSKKQIKLGVENASPDVLAKFKKDEKGKYYNERMDFEKVKRRNYEQSRLENGKKGGRPKNHMDNHMDNHMGNHTENENNYVIQSNTLEHSTDLFPFSQNNNNNNSRSINAYTQEECGKEECGKNDNIELEIAQYFSKRKFVSNPEDFIAYNKARGWKGFGGEDVRADFTRYADRWEEENLRRKGMLEWEAPII